VDLRGRFFIAGWMAGDRNLILAGDLIYFNIELFDIVFKA
jgi:hypothetical protein